MENRRFRSVPALLRILFFPLLLISGTLRGEEPFAFEKTPGKLPKDVVPAYYSIELDVDPFSVEIPTFSGSERIAIRVLKPVSQIVLNAVGLKILSATLGTGGRDIRLAPVIDAAAQTVTFPLAEELPAGNHSLTIFFSGRLSEQPRGLYLSRVKAGGKERVIAATQFEATDARRMFPCWDEPVFRARFSLNAQVQKGFGAVSNMPGVRSHSGTTGDSYQFEPTPPMSTYLLAFAAGEFEKIEDEIDGIKLGIFTTPGKSEQARYAMEATKKIVHFYNEYFGQNYPLPKLDQVALPSTGASGMENWGCIIYDENALLFDPATSSQRTRERVFSVVAHEIAHQWFGNLVTMAWWDNLWLNEGFASWMGTKATDHFNPDWKVWLRAARDKEWAMHLDARATTHPIQQPIASESQAMDAFDQITYQKGQAVLRMIEKWLGEDKFRDGIRGYLAKHAYSNSTTADLWRALENSSGKPVRALAAGWTEQPGFPVVKMRAEAVADGLSEKNATADDSETVGSKAKDAVADLFPAAPSASSAVPASEVSAVVLEQERFTIHQKNAMALLWKIPVAVGPAGAPPRAELVLLEAKPSTLPFDSTAAAKGNIGAAGYFRVSYDAPLWKRLRKAAPHLAEADRLNLLNDAWAMAQAGRAPVSDYLDLAETLAEDRSPAVLEQMIGVFWGIDALERGSEKRREFREWTRSFLRPHFVRLGWEARPGESPLDAQLRTSLIGVLGAFLDETVIREANARFITFLANPASLAGDLRGPVFAIVGREADAATWDQLRALAKRDESIEQKRALYAGLAASRDPALARQTLALSLDSELQPSDAARLVGRVAHEGEQPALAWDFARAHLEALMAKLPALGVNDYVPGIFRAFDDTARADELEVFGRANLPAGAAPAIAIAADDIRFRAEFKTRALPQIEAWWRTKLAAKDTR